MGDPKGTDIENFTAFAKKAKWLIGLIALSVVIFFFTQKRKVTKDTKTIYRHEGKIEAYQATAKTALAKDQEIKSKVDSLIKSHEVRIYKTVFVSEQELQAQIDSILNNYHKSKPKR